MIRDSDSGRYINRPQSPVLKILLSEGVSILQADMVQRKKN